MPQNNTRLGNYGNHAGSDAKWRRLHQASPNRTSSGHADTLILNRTAPCLRGMKVRLVTGTRFSRNIEWQVLLAATVWGTWVSLVFEDDVAARKSQ
jgi:hypothetical protein